MDIYDYRNRSGDFDTVSMKLDTFNAHQLQKAAEAIKAIEVESITENRQCWINWFNIALLPIIQDFAEKSGSLLIVDNNVAQGIMTVEIHNCEGLDISTNCMLRAVMFTAVRISIDRDENGAVLVLIFDGNQYT